MTFAVQSSAAMAIRRVPALAAARVVCLVSLAACGRVEPVGEDAGAAALMRSLLAARRVEVVVPDGPALEVCQRLARRYSGRHGAEYATVSPHTSRDERAARIFVGTSRETEARRFVERLGIQVSQGETAPQFRLQNQVFDGPADALIATFQDPERPGLPVTVFFGNDIERVCAYLGELEPGWKPTLSVYRRGNLVLSAPLTVTGEMVRQRIERPSALNPDAVPKLVQRAAGANFLSVSAPPDLDANAVRAYVDAAFLAAAKLAAWSAPDQSIAPVSLTLYGYPEDLELATGVRDLGYWNPVSGSTHALCSEWIPGGDGGAAVARACAAAALGRAVEPWLEDGAAVDAAGAWWGRDLASWLAWLDAGGIVLSLEDIVGARSAERISPHVLQPMRAAFLRFLVDDRGASFVRQLWRGTSGLVIDDALRASFTARMSAVAARERGAIESSRAARAARAFPAFLKGAGMEAPSGGPLAGFGTRACMRSVTDVEVLGANALAVSSFLVNEPDPARHPSLTARTLWAPIESDVALAITLRRAGRSGLRTLVLPHLLSGPAGTWSGGWPRLQRAGWAAFFDDYTRFITHYALLAELCDADALSLGSGLIDVARSTVEGRRADPLDIEYKRAGWERVTRAARGAFYGRLTYVARSLDEAHKIAFWPQLDYIGYEIYGELGTGSGTGAATIREDLAQRLRVELSSLEEVAVRDGKPIVLAQVGFSSGASVPGLARFGPGSTDISLQAVQYDVLNRVVAGFAPRRRFAGLFVWRFSTDPADLGANARDFVIHDATTRDVLRGWFEGL